MCVMCEHQSGRRFAGYAWGPSDSTKCPSNFFHIATEDACKAAAAANGKTYGGPASPNPDRPKGCFWNEENGNNVFFNTDPVGAAFPRRLPLCIGAPLRRQSRVLRRSAHTSDANRCGTIQRRTQRARTGYTKGTQRVLKGHSKLPQRSLTGLSEGTHRVLKQGHSRKGAHSSGESAFGCLRKYSWDHGGSTVMLCRGMAFVVQYGVYSRGAHTVLTATGSHRVLPGYPRYGVLSPAAAVRSDARARAATEWYSRGTHRVLVGYL
jgi:hypothetical protein